MTSGAARRPIVLCGMMLSGKSTTGSVLAARLGWAFMDLDAEIVRRSGRSIPDWFRDGEPEFRRAEREALAALLSESGPRVVAAGGGALEDDASRRLCRSVAFVVYLEATPAVLAARLSGASGRPLLDGAEDPEAVLAELLAERRANYLAAQHLRLPADGGSPDELARAIIDAYGKHTTR